MGDERTGSDTDARDVSQGRCAAFGCQLPGTDRRGDAWLCYCHFEASPGTTDLVTRAIRRHRAVYTATLDVRASACTDEWLRVYRQVQQRLFDGGYEDLLPDRRDFSPYHPGRPIVQQWLTRLERFLADAVRDEVRQVLAQTNPEPVAKRPSLSSHECVKRMSEQLAAHAARIPSPQWAFDLLDSIAANDYAPQKPYALRSTQSARQPVAPVWRPQPRTSGGAGASPSKPSAARWRRSCRRASPARTTKLSTVRLKNDRV